MVKLNLLEDQFERSKDYMECKNLNRSLRHMELSVDQPEDRRGKSV